MANASLEDCQLFAQSEILQRDLFIAAKDQEDHPKKREDCVQHEAESVSASSLKINRFRNRWNSGEAQVGTFAVSSRCSSAKAFRVGPPPYAQSPTVSSTCASITRSAWCTKSNAFS